jgi:beta-glucanase (GH16 family)
MRELRLDRRVIVGGGLAVAAGAFLLRPTAPESATTGTIDPTAFDPTFEDNFRSFDRVVGAGRKGRWQTVFGNGGPDALDNRSLTNNKEEQVYLDPEFRGLGLDPFKLTPAGLTITADRTPSFIRGQLWDKPFTSGLITTRGTFSQLYGYFEVRARLPRGKGLWPAFWMMPTSGGWPPELDVMENLGADPMGYVVTAHSKLAKPSAHVVKAGADLSAAPHAFGVAWTAQELVWYLDRREVARQPTPADMNRPMYMLINLAVGGTWGGSPDATTVFPAVYTIEAVRAWRMPNA